MIESRVVAGMAELRAVDVPDTILAAGRRGFRWNSPSTASYVRTRSKGGSALAATDWNYRTAADLILALDKRQVSAVELTESAIARIEACEPRINAMPVRDFDRAREAARAADAALKRGERKPLLGIPITIKESYNVAGLPTTWGMPMFRDFTPAEDALSVARVKQAGAVILGKTNVPLALADWQSYNEIYGVTNNPWDLGRTPGGSSGGSAAALAAGYGPLSLGSDIGGSLRAPAHYCGVYAHKPTYALVASRGHTPPPFAPLPLERDLAVVGPMARSAKDLALAFEVLAGPDRRAKASATAWRCRRPATAISKASACSSSIHILACRRRARSAARSRSCAGG
jgi:amidase